MKPEYIVLISLCSIFVLAVLVSLLVIFLIATSKRYEKMEKYKCVKYAHRGLHDTERAENSLSAFKRAKEAKFGIELDIRLSRDGVPVVFHDATLMRVCAVEGKVSDFTLDELKTMKLMGTDDTIPTLSEVLELIDGDVPLLIELKMEPGEYDIAERFLEVIEDYQGEYIVESFNPVALKVIRKKRPDILRGILSCKYMDDEKYRGKLLYFLLENLAFNFMARPDFISYEKGGHRKKAVRFLRRTYKAPLFAWTVESEEEEIKAASHGFDTVIFEKYIPEKTTF